ncbi:GNAT family N-acetyltransferase [Nocardiopsis sp. NRRL B-16309]|uniref:GNAT family N-acetyltransferase n=1 Tax=Nocardiopsis sp. NRRL B-16309 TaxID=1519494 RepID=UPI0006B06460|nr:GNAT family protein [Nocardiopsis sp. NRRL B-16309]KOX17104.1 GCN5 family acetyltransferase [Nocardiopsis sp. NRRL B-16309]
MVPPDVFREQPVLTGGRVRLEPLDGENGAALVDGYVAMDPVVRRLTGTHQRFTAEVLHEWFATRPDQHDRADWAIVEREGGTVVGECALVDLDPENAAADYRISLRNMALTGRGYGTEATDLVLDYAFDTAGLHRIALQVFAFNVGAQRSYARSGFVREGVWRAHLRWDGEWHDTVLMSVLAEEHARHRAERRAGA